MKMKKKLFIPLIAALLTIGLTSVGFAAWVIVGGDQQKVDDATFTAYAVTDERYSFTAAVAGNIVWGHPSETTMNSISDPWLIFRNQADTQENLTVQLTLTPATGNTNYKGNTVVYEVAVSASGDAWAAVTGSNKYVAAPENATYEVTYGANGAITAVTKDVNGNKTTLTEAATAEATKTTYVEGSNGAITISLDFSWGSYFTHEGNIVNPYVYFNNKSLASIGDEAYSIMQKIGALTSTNYVVTVDGEIKG